MTALDDLAAKVPEVAAAHSGVPQASGMADNELTCLRKVADCDAVLEDVAALAEGET